MESASDERYQPFLENRKHTTSCHWVSRAERGNYNQSKANWPPQRQEDLAPAALWEAGQDSGKSQWFSIQYLFLTQPLTCSPFSPPQGTLSPLSVTVLPCASEEDAGIESGKTGVYTGKQGTEVREQSAQSGVQGQGTL